MKNTVPNGPVALSRLHVANLEETLAKILAAIGEGMAPGIPEFMEHRGELNGTCTVEFERNAHSLIIEVTVRHATADDLAAMDRSIAERGLVP